MSESHSERGVRRQVSNADKQSTEIATATISLGLWALAWYFTTGFPENAQTYPRFVLLCLFGFSTIQLISGVWRELRRHQRQGGGVPDDPREEEQRPDSPAPTVGESGATKSLKPLLFLIIGAIVYVVLLPHAGFILATSIFLVVGVCASIGWRIRYAVVATSFVVILYLLMGVLLGIRLPSGVLF